VTVSITSSRSSPDHFPACLSNAAAVDLRLSGGIAGKTTVIRPSVALVAFFAGFAAGFVWLGRLAFAVFIQTSCEARASSMFGRHIRTRSAILKFALGLANLMSATQIRVPRMHALPKQTFGSIEIRCSNSSRVMECLLVASSR
jgi:hypothetical protein